MQLRRAGGRVRYLPADLASWPLVLLGLALLSKLRVISNVVAGGPRTVRIVMSAPDGWLQDGWSWFGFLLLAAGVALVTYSARRPDPHRRGTAVRYPAFSAAALLLALCTLLSGWDAFGHVADVGTGGAQWRFQVQERTSLANDVTTFVLGLLALGCYAMSFGPNRWADFEAYAARQATRDRVPASTADMASTSSTSADGVATHTRSRRS